MAVPPCFTQGMRTPAAQQAPSIVPSEPLMTPISSGMYIQAILPLVGLAPNTGCPGGTPVESAGPGTLHVRPTPNGAWVLYKDSRLKESCKDGLYWMNTTTGQREPHQALSNQFAPASMAACSAKPAQVRTPVTLQAVPMLIHMTFSLP